jgi:hypothetical protein
VTRGRKRTAREDPRPETRRVTHCPQGHEYTAENSIFTSLGYRRCRTCQLRQSRRAFRRKLYGLEIEQYEFLLAQQQDRCAICGSSDNGGVALGVDHDHVTGIVRGLLCDKCNQAIGALREDPQLFQKAIAYLRRPPPALPALAPNSPEFVCGSCGRCFGGTRRRRRVNGRLVALCPSCITGEPTGRVTRQGVAGLKGTAKSVVTRRLFPPAQPHRTPSSSADH